MRYSLHILEVGILKQWILSLLSAKFSCVIMEISGEMLNIIVECKPDSVPNSEIRARNEVCHEDEYLCLLYVTKSFTHIL
jgi:hypothetical protein